MTRERAAEILRALWVFAAGAVAMLCYLHFTLVPRVAAVERLFNPALLLYFVFVLADSLLQPKRDRQRSLADVSPANSGVGVVLATGAIAAYGLARDYRQSADLIAPGLVVLATIATAVAVARFARRHEGEIGEARFDTRNRDAR